MNVQQNGFTGTTIVINYTTEVNEVETIVKY